jgi:hypothetical protein
VLSWLRATRSLVLLSGHVHTYEGKYKKTGRKYKGWALHVDSILSEKFANSDEEASIDQNMVLLSGRVESIKKMPYSRLKVLLAGHGTDGEPCTPEVVMYEGTVDGLEEGMDILLSAYLNTRTIKDPENASGSLAHRRLA